MTRVDGGGIGLARRLGVERDLLTGVVHGGALRGTGAGDTVESMATGNLGGCGRPWRGRIERDRTTLVIDRRAQAARWTGQAVETGGGRVDQRRAGAGRGTGGEGGLSSPH